MIKSRQYMSGIHLHAAHLFLRGARELQAETEDCVPKPTNRADLAAYASATILHSVCFLESNINEHFLDIIDRSQPRSLQVSPDVAVTTQIAWKSLSGAGPRILQKYRAGAAAFGVEGGLGQAEEPATALIYLRNALTHYEPENLIDSTTGVGLEVRTRGLERLRGYVNRNPWSEGVHSGTTSAIMSHGTARWALTAAIDLAEAFHSLTGHRGPMQAYRGSLRKKIEYELAA